ncbi:hypothetical protein ACYULU_07955 [Breznakiellaceae bacterium SP9]
MSSNFKKIFMKLGYNSEDVAKLIPDGIFPEDKINADVLKSFRELEEKAFGKKQGEM